MAKETMTTRRSVKALFFRFAEQISLAGILLVAILIRLRNLDSPVSGLYMFRTTQTAWGIRSVAEGSISPFSIETPVLGPPWKIPFEFPLYQIIAGVFSRLTGFEAEIAGRLVSIAFFGLTALVFYQILRYLFDLKISLTVLVVFVFCAHNLEYGSSPLIEYCALFFALLGFLNAIRFIESNSYRYFALFTLSAAIVGLVKITTSVVWVGVGTFALFVKLKPKRYTTAVLVFGVILSQIPAIAWTRWADSQKEKSPWTYELTSKKLSSWNFGTIRQRLHYFDWNHSVLQEFFPSVIGSTHTIIFLLIVGISMRKTRMTTTLFLAIFLSGPLLFTNLYFVHDYYWTAVLPALLISLAFGMDGLLSTDWLQQLKKDFNSTIFGVLAVLALVVSSWFTPHGFRHFEVFARPGRIDFNKEEDLIAVKQLTNFTKATDEILVVGAYWNPSILYFSNRRGLMLRDNLTELESSAISELNEFDYILVVNQELVGSPLWEKLESKYTITQLTKILYSIKSQTD